jgi:hypothetical protein
MPSTPPRPRGTERAARDARARAARRRVYRRRRLVAGGVALLVVATAVVVASALASGGGAPGVGGGGQGSIPSIEAGLEPWQLPAAVSRESVVPAPGGITVLGGLNQSGASVATVTTLTSSGAAHAAAPLTTAVHDASAATLGSSTFVFGGGSPTTVATVQVLSPGAGRSLSHPLSSPRSDSAAVTIDGTSGPTAYVVGGYTGSSYLPEVLATKDGRTYRDLAALKVPVRYPAVAAAGTTLYVLGGEVASSGSATAATADVQAVDTTTGAVSVVATLPQPLYGAAAFTLDGVVYVAGGETPQGGTLTEIDAFVPTTHRVLFAGLLPQAVAFGGATTVGAGATATGFLVGGEVASQSGPDQAGVASGTLRTVLALRPSPYGGAAGTPHAGTPYGGKLLVADRGNDRLLVLTPARQISWAYPSATKPPPPGGFYFPDDAFFFKHGTGIISNQEDNHTIVEIAYPSGRILWDYGHARHPGSAPGYLDQPDDAYYWRNGLVSVADASNNRVVFLSPSKAVVSQIGNGVDAHVPGVSIAYPNGDTPLADGDVLVSEVNGSWISEYTPAGHVVWTRHFPQVAYPSDPQQLDPDLYLMTDYNPAGEGRIVEFTRSGRIVWRYDSTAGDAALKRPSLAERLPNGLIMVNDDYRDRVVVIDPTTHWIVWQYGLTDLAGTSPGRLSIPDGFDLLEPGGVTPTHPQTG